MWEAYPALDKHPAYWRLANWLLFGTYCDRLTGQLIIARPTLAEIEGRERDLANHRYNATPFLRAFSADVAPIDTSTWRYVEGQARVVRSPVFTPDICAARNDELRSPALMERVAFVNGKPYTRDTRRDRREADCARAKRLMPGAVDTPTHDLLAYMNSLPPHRFTKTLDHLPAASAAVESAMIAWHERERRRGYPAEQLEERLKIAERLRLRQYSLLCAVAEQPQPFYKPVAHSARIFPCNESVLSLMRQVRAAMIPDWVGFDLRSAQLAICAVTWGVRPLQSFLESHRSIWDELGAGADESLKAACKSGIYALTFGAYQTTVEYEFLKEGRTRAEARRFLQHPLVQAMCEARAAQFETIITDGGAENCFGRWLSPPLKWNARCRHWRPNLRSVLAQLAQAWELRLLLPVLNLARTTDQFRIMLWVHDGVYVDFRDQSRAQFWSRRIIAAVNQEAQKLGIPTGLERSH
jgi:hypothetical protein